MLLRRFLILKQVLGILVIEDKRDVAINAEVIMVHGVFRAGYAKRPFQHQLTITMTGEPTSDDVIDPETGKTLTNALGHSMGTKVIGVMAKGDQVTDKWCNSNAEGKSECSDHAVLELHGKYEQIKPTWTSLGKSAKKGDSLITMKQKVQWSAGDEIIIAGTDWQEGNGKDAIRSKINQQVNWFSMKEDNWQDSKEETATIASISDDGMQLTLTQPLTYNHYGELQNYPKGRVLDERAEVGLLSRNIIIQGDESTKTSFFGGHIMIMEGAVGRIEGVELRDVGQARLGRYPIHFHCFNDAPMGDLSYVRGNAVHRSWNRAYTLHAVHNLLVEDNIAYDVVGHAFFIEDGFETGNMLKHNLALKVKRASNTCTSPPVGDALDAFDANIKKKGK